MSDTGVKRSGLFGTPDVSVLMGVYNGGSDLEPTMRSVLDQQGCDFEFIVIDDGSSDGTAPLLDQMAATEPRLRVVHQQNQGLTKSLIKGCALARAPFIARQDCGDLSYPGRLAALAAWLQDHADVVLVASAYRHVGPRGELLERVGPRNTHEELREILRAGNPTTLYGPHHGSVMFRRSALDRAGGYREAFYFAQDLDLWTRMATLGEIHILADELYEVRFTHGSITARQTARQAALRQLIAEATRVRASGQSDAGVLARAAAVRPSNERPSTQGLADIDYFLGSCLASRGDPAARAYFLQALRRRPFMAKAWAKLIRSSLGRFGG